MRDVATRLELVGGADAAPDDPRPLSRLTAEVRFGAVMDRATLGAFRRFLKKPTPEQLERIATELHVARERFSAEGWLDDPESFHETPPPLLDVASRHVPAPTSFEWITWESRYDPREIEPGRERWRTYRQNKIARAAVLRHRDGPRPWMVCVHGFGMGRPGIDIPSFRAPRLYHRLGFNVVLPVLPLHGARRTELLSRFAGFPSVDILDDVHAAAQTAWDIRRLLSWIRTQHPTGIGLQGMSLGGFSTALVASLDGDLDVAGLLIPAAGLSELLLENAEDIPPEVIDDAVHLMHVIAPLKMTPKVDLDRRYIVAGTVDGLARPSLNAVPLWRHWGEPRLKWFHGAHNAVFYARGIGRFLDERWEDAGLLQPR